ncbi:uncharacterized protein [Nicotiana tomentosiformis]|uniref:uncharacterized protein n=1 Tax=Nicotiana tomentosiformis TaxID=4098 RepID=UPI00388C3BE2
MNDEEHKRMEHFGRLKPPEFSGVKSEDAQDFIDRDELRRQFEQLRQEGMSVTQYEMRFSELDRYAIWLVPTERERISRFIDGLKYGLHFIMTREIPSGVRFDEVVDISRRLEQVHSQEREERQAKRPRSSGVVSSALSGGHSHQGPPL